MKKFRKGFTLIELLIVVAIIGALSAMMATSSSDAIDSSAASAILNNLQTMKTAAFEMYMNVPEVASITTNVMIPNVTGSTKVTIGTTETTVAKVLGERLGRVDIPANYGLTGNETNGWYVYYTFQTSDTTNVKNKLAAAANKAGLLGVSMPIPSVFAALTSYYSNTSSGSTAAPSCIGLRVR